MASWGTPLRTLFNAIYEAVTGSLNVRMNPLALGFPDAYATKATGADAYAEILTPPDITGV